MTSLRPYVAYRMAPTTMTLSDVEVTLAVQNLYNSHNLANIAHINYNMYT